jgi:hypothetical protein
MLKSHLGLLRASIASHSNRLHCPGVERGGTTLVLFIRLQALVAAQAGGNFHFGRIHVGNARHILRQSIFGFLEGSNPVEIDWR